MAVGQLYCNVLNIYTGEVLNSTDVKGNNIDFSKDLVPQGGYWSRVGIQAPPGTIVLVGFNSTDTENDYIEFMVGRTGILEFNNDNLTIYHLHLKNQFNYTKNRNATKRALQEGLIGLETAKKDFEDAVEKLNIQNVNTENLEVSKEPYINYLKAYDNYVLAIASARASFSRGLNGVYEQNKKPEDFQNVIIDYVTTSNGGITTQNLGGEN